MRANKYLFSISLGLLIAFGPFFGLAQANSQVMEAKLPTATIFYVDADATGTATGSDWANAFTTVQDALAIAASGDQVFVAEGIYYPDEGNGQANDERTSAFTLLQGVALYGGFDPQGGVDAFGEQNWLAYPTILSGDIDHETQPDDTDPTGVVIDVSNLQGNNAYHVVSSSGVTAAAHLEGFIITAGLANDGTIGGGMYNVTSSPMLTNVTFSGNFSSAHGGGMYNATSNPTLTNVTFSGNATGLGGGIYNDSSNPTLTNVTFSDNWVSDHGGGIYNDNSSPTLTNVTFSGNSAVTGGGIINRNGSSPALTNVIFSGNSVSNAGGGMLNDACSPTLINVTFSANSAYVGGGMSNHNGSNPTLTNVAFFGNSTEANGGGMINNASSPTLINVTFSGNSSEMNGGGMANFNSSSPTLTNAILWGNMAVASGNQIYNGDSSNIPSIHFSDIDGCGGSDSWNANCGSDGGGNLDANPFFIRDPNPGNDGNWDGVDDDYGDLHLRPDSPAIDNGTNIGCPATDLDGNSRPIHAICDMGAYETGYALEISQAVSEAAPIPGQVITFTIVATNRGMDVSGGIISDTLPAGLDFLGPITLETGKSGVAGIAPPTLASGLMISYADQVTVTFPVRVSYGLSVYTLLTNTAMFSANEAISPVMASVTILVQNAAPVAVADGGTGFSTDKGTLITTTNVLANDSDPNGDTLAVFGLDTTGTLGLVINNGDGTFTYDPNGQFDTLEAGEQVTDTFTYAVSDGHGGNAAATVTITIYAEMARFIYLPLAIR